MAQAREGAAELERALADRPKICGGPLEKLKSALERLDSAVGGRGGNRPVPEGYDAKLKELKRALDESRDRLQELDKAHEHELNACLKQHKEQLVEYNRVVQSQSAEIQQFVSVVDESRKELADTKEENARLEAEIRALREQNTKLKSLAESQEKLVECQRNALMKKEPDEPENAVSPQPKEEDMSPDENPEKVVVEPEPEGEELDLSPSVDCIQKSEEPAKVASPEEAEIKIEGQDKSKSFDAGMMKDQEKGEQKYMNKSTMLRDEIQSLDQEIKDMQRNLGDMISKKKERLSAYS